MKFSCLLSYCIASRQYRQIFHHHQTIGDISNIADTYIWPSNLLVTEIFPKDNWPTHIWTTDIWPAHCIVNKALSKSFDQHFASIICLYAKRFSTKRRGTTLSPETCLRIPGSGLAPFCSNPSKIRNPANWTSRRIRPGPDAIKPFTAVI